MFGISLNLLSKNLVKLSYLLILLVIIYYQFFQDYFPSWLFFIPYDIKVYWASSDWIIGDKTLYINLPSEYPLFANFIFAICRLISWPLKNLIGDFNSFALSWYLMGISTLFITLKLIRNFIRNNIIIKLCWITPVIILFSGIRYDIYPVLFFILCLINLKNERLFIAAICLSISICLKGYALFALPSFIYYLYTNFGIKKTFYFVLTSISLFAISNLSILLILGKDALLFPYKYHAERTFNGQSSWDALRLTGLVNYLPGLPTFSAISFSVIGFLRKPKNFSEFIDSCVIAITGFSSSLVFYSPQFCFWTLSCATFSNNKRTCFLTLIFCLMTYIYYPLASVYYAAGTRNDKYSFYIFSVSILIVTLVRFLIIINSFSRPSGLKNKKFLLS